MEPEDIFKGFEELISGVAMVAQMSRAFYNAHLEVGFTKDEAMELTKANIHELWNLFRDVVPK